jgi:hypothetical protein
MTGPVPSFEFGFFTEYVTPSGRRYLRATIGGLCFTAIADPDRRPLPGGVMCWPVVTTPAPGRARNIRAPASTPAQIAEPTARQSDAQRLREAAADAIARNGAILLDGDPLDDLFPAADEPDVEEAIRLFETPLV